MTKLVCEERVCSKCCTAVAAPVSTVSTVISRSSNIDSSTRIPLKKIHTNGLQSGRRPATVSTGVFRKIKTLNKGKKGVHGPPRRRYSKNGESLPRHCHPQVKTAAKPACPSCTSIDACVRRSAPSRNKTHGRASLPRCPALFCTVYTYNCTPPRPNLKL